MNEVTARWLPGAGGQRLSAPACSGISAWTALLSLAFHETNCDYVSGPFRAEFGRETNWLECLGIVICRLDLEMAHTASTAKRAVT